MANYDLTYEGSRVQGILDTGNSLKDAGYIFRGEATPSTVPGTPTERVAYIGGPGTYTNFGSSITVGAGCICVFKYTGSAWSNQVINTGLSDAISSEAQTRSQADIALQNAINGEAQTRSQADNALQNAITAINNNIGNGYVYAGVATPSTSPVTGKVFYLAVQAGTYTNFGNAVVTAGLNVIKYNGSAWSVDQVIAIDAEPTQGSDHLVKSGGVLNSIIQNGPAFDLSAYNAVGGTLATYADLSAALTALNALPADFKKGGMSVKYVQTYDNKYIQARCMAQNFTTDVTKWQGVDDEPALNSKNLVESGGVAKKLSEKTQINISAYTETIGVITPNGEWYYAGKHIVLDVREGELYSIISNASNDSCISVLKTYSTSGSVNFSDYYNGRILFSGEITIVIPSDAHYIVVHTVAGDGSTDIKPQGIDKYVEYNVQEEFEKLQNGSVLDLSAYNNGATYADLNAALAALDTLPEKYKVGGMSMKYISNIDNIYHQFRLKSNTFTTDKTMWQGIDKKPVAGSKNLVESGGVAEVFSKKEEININYYTEFTGVIFPDGTWHQVGKHIVINVNYNELYTITSNGVNDACVSVLKTYSTSGSANFCDLYNSRIIFSGKIEILMPEDAHYLVVHTIGGDNVSDVEPRSIFKSTEYNLQEQFDGIENNIKDIKENISTKIELNYSIYDITSGVVSAEGKWYMQGSHIAIPVNGGEIYQLTPQTSKNINISFAKTYNASEVSSEVAVDFSDSYPSRNIIEETTTYTIPSDTHYMIVTIIGGDNITDVSPESITYITEKIEEALEPILNDIDSLKEQQEGGNFDCITFSGESLSIRRNLLYLSYFGGNIIPNRIDGNAAQGCAIFGNYFYQLFSNGICSKYKLTNTDITLINTFHLGSYGLENNHSNSAQFSNVLSQNNNPLLYVADGYSKCYVEEITENGSALVQTITADIGQTNVNYKNLQIGDDGFMWLFGTEPSSGPLSITKLRKVLPSEGSSVVLTSEDIVSQWSIPWDFTSNGCQGGKIYDGKLFFVYSQWHSGNRGILVVDTSSQEIKNNISFDSFTSLEIEDFDVYKDCILITSFDENTHPLIKVLNCS